MLHRIEDETGQRWFIGKGDPAHESIQQLHTGYYTWIVLPRQLIQGGWCLSLKHEWNWWWKRALRQARHLGYNSEGGKRYLRLAECLKALED